MIQLLPVAVIKIMESPMLRRMVGWGIVLLALLAALAWAYGRGAADRNAVWEGMLAKREVDNALALAKVEARARQVEQGWMGAYAELAGQLQKEKESVEAHRDRLLAAARSGGLRVPSCSATPGVPQATPGAAGGDAAAGGEFPGAAGAAPDLTEFLIREAARADGIAAQLAACQEAHRAIRSD